VRIYVHSVWARCLPHQTGRGSARSAPPARRRWLGHARHGSNRCNTSRPPRPPARCAARLSKPHPLTDDELAAIEPYAVDGTGR